MKCNCHIDQVLVDLFEEVFEVPFEKLEDIEDSLLHSDAFHLLVDAIHDEDSDPYTVMADAIRCGMEVGRRLNEIRGLGKMVGIKKYDKRRKKR